MEKELLCLSYIFIILIRSAISAPAVTDSSTPSVEQVSTPSNEQFLLNEKSAANISNSSQDDQANLNNSSADELINSKSEDKTDASFSLNEISDNQTSKQKDNTTEIGEATPKTKVSFKSLIAIIDKLTKLTSSQETESTTPSIDTVPSTASQGSTRSETAEVSVELNDTDPGTEHGRSELTSEKGVLDNSSKTLQENVVFESPEPFNFSLNNSEESENLTEPLEARDASTETADILIPSSSWSSLPEDASPVLNSAISNSKTLELSEMSLNDTRNSSLVENVEFVLSHASNLSDSAFVNELADLVVSISAMNGSDDFLVSEKAGPEEPFKLENSSEIGEMRSSIDSENEISNSTLEAKSESQNASESQKMEDISNANISIESNVISDGNSSVLYSGGEFVTDDITSTVSSDLTEPSSEINSSLVPFPTAILNLESSTEFVELISTQSAEISSTEWPEVAETSADENLQQRNEISTGTSLIKKSPEPVEIQPLTSEATESTTMSGDELFSNTPLEYFINSTTIARLDLTTVASIATPQGTPTPSLLELLNRNSPKTTCTHQGREYSTGQHIDQLDPCHFCVCVNGYLDCYWKNCPPPPEGCMELDFDGVCDRSLYLCPIPKKGEPLPFPVNPISRYRREANYTQMTCDILGVQYKVGELVGVASDPCMECRCALDSLYCSPKCCFQPVESGQDPSKNSRANDAVWQPVLAHPLKHLRYEFENQ